MIDPITAASLATTAFTGVKKFIEAGKSVEDTMMVVARWQGHISDFAWSLKREQKKSKKKRQVFIYCFDRDWETL